MTTFTVSFAPNTTDTINALLIMDVGAFDISSGYSADLTAFLSIDSVVNLTEPLPTPMPEPGTLTLFGVGFLAMGLISRRRTRDRPRFGRVG